MPEKKITPGRVILYIILSILLAFIIANNYEIDEVMETDYSIPPKPEPGVPMIYDFDDEKWVRIYSEPRAKAKESSNSDGLTEKELQRYLEKKVPGYFEDTYWGQEYGIDDPEDLDDYE